VGVVLMQTKIKPGFNVPKCQLPGFNRGVIGSSHHDLKENPKNPKKNISQIARLINANVRL